MILLAAAGFWLAMAPWLARRIRRERRRGRLASQLRQALQQLAHALRVGVGLMQALEYVAKDAEEPLGPHWRWLLQAARVGKPLPEALDGLARRVPLREMGWFVAAVQITHATGGSLAEVLETLATTLQEQQILREKVSALTAQGQASGFLLSALPFLLMGALWFLAPDLMAPMFSTWMGQLMIATVMVLVGLGGLVIKKIVTIPVD